MNRTALTALMVLTGFGGTLEAQQGPRFTFFGGVMGVRVQDAANSSIVTLSSALPTADVGAMLGRAFLEGRYSEGGLHPSNSTLPNRDMVEGRILAGFQVMPSLGFALGPHARSYVLPSGTRQRLMWELHGLVSTPIASDLAMARLDLWVALTGHSNIAEELDQARGGEASLSVHIPRSPVWARLGYRVERTQMNAGTRGDTVEGLIVALGVALPAR